MCVSCRKRRVQLASRDVRLVETYGITVEEYKTLLEAQGGVCAICKGRRSYNYDVDHDHALEQLVGVRASIRGLLCKQCNRRVLRSVRDSTELLRSAIAYLENPPAQRALTPVRRSADSI